MQCAHCLPDIPDLVSGRLPAAERLRLEEHLRTCASCRAVAATFAPVMTAPRAAERPVDPMDFARMRVAVNARIDAGESRTGARWLKLPRTAWMAAVPAVMAVALLVLSPAREMVPVDRTALHRDILNVVTSLDASQVAALAAEHQVPVSVVDTRFESAALGGHDTALERTIASQMFADLSAHEIVHAGTSYLADADVIGATSVTDEEMLLEGDPQPIH